MGLSSITQESSFRQLKNKSLLQMIFWVIFSSLYFYNSRKGSIREKRGEGVYSWLEPGRFSHQLTPIIFYLWYVNKLIRNNYIYLSPLFQLFSSPFFFLSSFVPFLFNTSFNCHHKLTRAVWKQTQYGTFPCCQSTTEVILKEQPRAWLWPEWGLTRDENTESGLTAHWESSCFHIPHGAPCNILPPPSLSLAKGKL